jgi:DNA sulfur modification protein DndB
VAARYRTRHGGHVLFRPIGLLLVVRTISELMESGFSVVRACRSVARVSMELAEKPWAGLLWDGTNSRMITAGENQKAAFRLLFVAAGGRADHLGTTVEEICRVTSGILNISPCAAALSDLLR